VSLPLVRYSERVILRAERMGMRAERDGISTAILTASKNAVADGTGALTIGI